MTSVEADELRRISQLVDVALLVPERERASALRRACGADEGLFKKVSAILRQLDEAPDFLLDAAVFVLQPSGATQDVDDTGRTAFEAARNARPNESIRDVTSRRARWNRRTLRRYLVGFLVILSAGVAGALLPRLQRVMTTRGSPAVVDSLQLSAQGAGSSEKDRNRDIPTVIKAREEVDLARILEGRGAYDSAEVRLRAALVMLTAAGDDASLDVAEAKHVLGRALDKTARPIEAERELRAALQLYREYLEPGDARLTEVIRSLADLLQKTGREAEADSLRRSSSGTLREQLTITTRNLWQLAV